MPRRSFALLLLAVSLAAAQDRTAQLPSPERWLQHFERELLPFWDQPAAFGNPIGNFPTTRCDDGTRVDLRNPCREVGRNSWLMLDRQYVVAVSRQIYGYGVAYHLTGETRYLDYARAGIEHLRRNAMDRTNGGVHAWYENDRRRWMPASHEHRNPQELAYALLGIGFYYYLTRDPDVLPDILAVKKYIFDKYDNRELNALQWLQRDDGNTKALERRLTATLDQMNAYMVLLAPVLPEPHRTEWTNDLVRLSRMMMETFYSPKDNLFFLNATTAEDKDLARVTVDYGHTIKSLWMIRWTGRLAGNEELIRFAEEAGPRVLATAFLEDSGSWATAVTPTGIDKNKSWWVYAELDQFAGTIAISDRTLTRYLARTYDYWLSYFVDPKYGEVWTTVNAANNQNLADMPKAWPWKNAYHSMEHALVAYLTTSELQDRPVTLYFAFKVPPEDSTIRPYFFNGWITGWEDLTAERGTYCHRVQFRGLW
ncbi:MAG: AGE family epimerase/isomerase [Bryobacteraceae bacterium]|nr:AGE family epimerase/isomerase [Bryobacteraceae bacterium]